MLHPRPLIHLAADLDALSLGVAEAVTAAMTDAVRTRGRCSLVLSGGNTPRGLYARLGSTFRDRIPWAETHVFWADERFVAATHPDNNARMAREVLLDHVPCPAHQIHAIPTSLESTDAAAADYERTLRQFLSSGSSAFDVVILGMGEEGHTASLFPQSPALAETTRWVVGVDVPASPRQRVTLTMPLLTQAAHRFVLVSGATKAEALTHVLGESPDVMQYPAAALRTSRGAVSWWIDRNAAAHLPADVMS